MSFIPLLISISSVEEVERGVKYFLIQALGRGFFLLGGFWIYSLSIINEKDYLRLFCSFLFLMGLLLKLGSFPFHFWVPSVIRSLSWIGCLLLATWQKLAPLFVFFWFFFRKWFGIVILFGVISSLVGGLGGINQVQIRILMAYSSINHLGWIIVVAAFSFFGLLSYYSIYFIISFTIFLLLFYINFGRVRQISVLFENKIMMVFVCLLLISLAGLPPFTGFLGKWVVFQELVINNHNFVLLVLIFGSFFSLYFYFNLFFSIFLVNSVNYVFFSGKKSRWNLFFISLIVHMSLFGLVIFELFYRLFCICSVRKHVRFSF